MERTAMRGWMRLLGAVLSAALVGCGLILPNTPLCNTDAFFNTGTAPAEANAAEAPFFLREAIFQQILGRIGSHAATITAFSDGELLAAWYSYSGPEELDGADIYLSRKTKDVAAWEAPQLVIDRPEADGNPVLYSEGDRVWLFQAVVPFGWSTAHIEVQQSADRGKTWQTPQWVSGAIGSNTRFAPIRTATGSLLLPAYDDLLGRSLFFESTDGQEWQFLAAVFSLPGNIQPSVVRLDDDRLLAVMRPLQAGSLWVTESCDSGHTWSSPRESGFANPVSPAALLRLANGHLVLVFNDSTTERNPLAVAVSLDDGLSWSPAREIARADGGCSYPSAVQTNDGRVHVVFSVGRERIDHVAFNEAWIGAGVEISE